MDAFDEDDFIFIESDNAAEQEDALGDGSPERQAGNTFTPAPSVTSPAAVVMSQDNITPRKAKKGVNVNKKKLKTVQAISSDRDSTEPHSWLPAPGAGRSRSGVGSSGRRRRRRQEPEPPQDSDEETWLQQTDATEEPDDPEVRLMASAPLTSRQRARLEKLARGSSERAPASEVNTPEQEVTGPPEPSPEVRERHQRKLERRRLQAIQQRELNKRRTVRRLLTKGAEKPAPSSAVTATTVVSSQPAVRYIQSADRTLLILPPGLDVAHLTGWCLTSASASGVIKDSAGAAAAADAGSALRPPHVRTCSIEGCGQPRSYCCRRTGAPLCHSLQCYQQNLKLNGCAS